MNRSDAYALLIEYNNENSLIEHSLQTEAVMAKIAERLNEDVSLWSITGLLHDLDFGQTKMQPVEHGKITAKLLAGQLPDNAIQAILAHNSEWTEVQPQSNFDFALRCCESVTGLISANALVRPGGMDGMTAKSLKKKMKEKAFAANVNRENIKECEKLGLDLTEFFDLSIAAMSGLVSISTHKKID